VTEQHCKRPTPIDQAEIIPLSEKSAIFHGIQENLFKLEALDPDCPELILDYIKISIDAAIRKIKRKNQENHVQSIPFPKVAGGAR